MAHPRTRHRPSIDAEVAGGNIVSLGGSFCLICGAEPPLHADRLCEACLRERHVLFEIEPNLQYTVCRRCDAVERRGKWLPLVEEEVWDDLIETHLRLHPDVEGAQVGWVAHRVDERNTLLHIDGEGTIHGLEFRSEGRTRARRSNGVCLTCTRRDGNYFEATVQLRSSARRLDEAEVAELRATLDEVLEDLPPDPMFFVTKEGPTVGGWDITLGSKGLARTWARALVQRWGGQVKETTSTVGRRDGVDVTRLTVLYRRPGYGIGDVLRFKEALWRVAGWTPDGALLLRVERSERLGATWRDLERSRVVALNKDILVVDILHRDATVAEVMEPISWTTIPIRIPWDHGESGRLRIARIDDAWIGVPSLGSEQ